MRSRFLCVHDRNMIRAGLITLATLLYIMLFMYFHNNSISLFPFFRNISQFLHVKDPSYCEKYLKDNNRIACSAFDFTLIFVL